MWVNIGSVNGSLPDDTKAIAWTNVDLSSVSFSFAWGQFHKGFLNHKSLKLTWKLLIWNFIKIFQGTMC